MKVVIIGASFGGISAAVHIRKKHPEAEVILLEKQHDLGYLPSGLNLLLSKKIESLDEAYFATEEDLGEKGIEVRLGSEVYRVDTQQKSVFYQTEKGTDTCMYDKLIIASGSNPASQKISGSASERVLLYKNRSQTEETLKKMQQSDRIAIIGGGQAGMEAADTLSGIGKQVTVIESMEHLLFKSFDQEMMRPIQEKLMQRGVSVKLNQTVTAIEEQANQLMLTLGTETMTCDAALVTVNVRPDIPFLEGQLTLQVDGTLAVDEYLRTSDPDIFGVGDVIQMRSPLTGESIYMPLANNAIRTGMIAAENLKEPVRRFSGSLRTLATHLFGWYVASTGMTEADTLFYDRRVNVHRKEGTASLLPDAKKVYVKYMEDAETGVLLGVQMAAEENLLHLINTFTLAIHTGQTLDALAGKEYFFQSAYTNMIDITNLGESF